MQNFMAFRVYNEDGQYSGRVEQISHGDLGPGEVLIRNVYSSVNYKDALAVTGKGKILTKFPMVPGVDLAGFVVASDDPRFAKNDPVLATGYELGISHPGGYAELARVPAEWVVPLPRELSLFDAMLLGTAGFTVALCIKRLEDNHQSPDQGPFVITGASGGVGTIACQILAQLGYQVTAITGKPSQVDFLHQLGAQEVLLRENLDYGSRPLEKALWTGAIDNLGGEMLAWLLRTTKPWGNVVSVGLAGSSQFSSSVMPFILRGVSLIGVTSAGCPTKLRQLLWQRLSTDLYPSKLAAIHAQTIVLDELPAVCAAMLDGKTWGRILVKLSSE